MFFISTWKLYPEGFASCCHSVYLGAAGFQILTDTLSTSVLFVLCSVNQFYFINKDKFKSLKPTWGESSPSPQNQHMQPWHHCHLGLGCGMFVSVPGLYPQDTRAALPRNVSRPHRCPLGLALTVVRTPGRCCPGSVCLSPSWSVIMKIASCPSEHLSQFHKFFRWNSEAFLTRADILFLFSVVNETNCRWPVTR